MKKVLKSRLFVAIITAIICITGTAYAAGQIFANDIGYTPSDSTWKKSNGEDITNVKDAIDDLYTKANNFGNLQIVEYKGNNANGTTVDVEIGDLIFVSSPATTYATNSEKIIGSLSGGSFNGIGTYTCVFRATSTSIRITADNNCNFSYIIVRG